MTGTLQFNEKIDHSKTKTERRTTDGKEANITVQLNNYKRIYQRSYQRNGSPAQPSQAIKNDRRYLTEKISEQIDINEEQQGFQYNRSILNVVM